MINYHPQAAIAQLQAAIAQLQEFIYLPPNVREVRKALAVLLVYLDYLYIDKLPLRLGFHCHNSHQSQAYTNTLNS